MSWLIDHQATLWILLGITILVLELLVLGMASGVLLFIGLAALLTGLLLWAGLVPEGVVFSLAVFSVLVTLITLVLWKPLKALQGDGPTLGHDSSSDFIGLEFISNQIIEPGSSATARYSGIDWKLVLSDQAGVDSIASGARVRVVGVDAGIFYVVPK